MKYMLMPPKGHRIVPRAIVKETGIMSIQQHIWENFRRINEDHLYINWGNSHLPNVFNHENVLNKAKAVGRAVNKLKTWRMLLEAGIPTVVWTTDVEEAAKWHMDGVVVYARTLVGASRGRGITVQIPGNEWIHNRDYRVFTKRFSGKEEYRVHVFNGEVIFIQQKKRKEGVETNKYIKNVDGGYVFAIQGVTGNETIIRASIKAVSALGLHFGAVDVGYGVSSGNCCVYEVNTRPYLEGSSIQAYINKIGDI